MKPNSFILNRKSTSLIEYAAFYGSIQIFQFLKINNVRLEQSLWLVIHSVNAELIHLLDYENVLPIGLSYDDLYVESPQ